MSPAFATLKPTDPYYGNWVEMRRRAKIKWLLFLCWPLMICLNSMVVHVITGSPSGAVWFVLVWIVILYLAGMWQMQWPCPRCNQPFYYRNAFSQRPWADNCLHCGLREYAPC